MKIATLKNNWKIFYLSGWIEKAGKMEYDKETSKKRISTSERG